MLVMRYAAALNLKLSKTARGHWRLLDPVTRKTAIVANGSSERHALRNAEQTIRQIFGKTQETQLKQPVVTNVIVTERNNGLSASALSHFENEPIVKEPVPVVTPAPVTMRKPTTWRHAILDIQATQGITSGEIATLLGVKLDTVQQWSNNKSRPRTATVAAMKELFPGIDFSGAPEERRAGRAPGGPAKKPVKAVESPKVVEPVKGAAYWATVAVLAVKTQNLAKEIEAKGVSQRDVQQFLEMLDA